MKNQPSFFSMTSSQTAELRSYLSRGDGFYHIGSSEIPTIVPLRLRDKWDSAAVVISGSTGPDGAIAIVGHRIDPKAGMMDHDPFVIAVSASVPHGSGVLVHHASYDSRSLQLPAGYLAALSSSGVTNYFKGQPPFGVPSGTLNEVPKPLIDALNLARSFISASAT
jgi:hypothetical protein